jgi:hypothetical protein
VIVDVGQLQVFDEVGRVRRWCDVPEENLVGEIPRRVIARNVQLLRVAPRGAVIPAVAFVVLQNGNLLGCELVGEVLPAAGRCRRVWVGS